MDPVNVETMERAAQAGDTDGQLSAVMAPPDSRFAGRAPRAGTLEACAPRRSETAAGLQFKDAPRVQESLLAPLESRCLRWLARRLPSWVSPDHLTLLGFAAQLLGGVSYALAGWWPMCLLIVDVFIAVNWFGDSLDGTLARMRNKQRPRYGFYVDHMTDTFGALFLICGLAISGHVSERVALAMLVGFLMLSVNTYLATYTIGTFRLSFWKFSPTEMRILLAVGNAYAFYHPVVHFLGSERRFFDVAGTVASISMGVVLVASTIRNTMLLYRAEKV